MRTERRVLTTRAPSETAYGLAGSINRINALLADDAKVRLRFGFPPDIGTSGTAGSGVVRGWHRCDKLLSHPREFDAWQRELKAWLRGEHGKSPDRTAAGYIRSWYLQAPGFLAAALFHHERRVPSLRPEDLAVQIATEGRPHPVGVAVRATAFACLPGDPAAGTRSATVVDSERALAALLRARFAGHAARFAAAFRPPVHFGPHTLWGAATDALDLGLWNAGRFGGDEGAGVTDAALVLPAPLEPYTSASTLHRSCGPDGQPVSSPDGGTVWTRRKETCCFHYLVGPNPCKTCPRVKPKR